MARFPKAWAAVNAAVARAQANAPVTARIDMSAQVAGQGNCPECKRPMEIVTAGATRVWSCAHDRITLPLPDGYQE